MITLDEIDRKLLRLLQKDASTPLDTLGEAVHLSRNACWRRIKALEKAGVIARRVTVLDPVKCGLGLTVFILIRTNAHAPDWLDKFRAATRSLPQVLGVYRMSGDLDYLVRAQVADMADYDRLYQSLIQRVPLSDVSASFVMEQIKDTSELPL
ncbi:Lrp/AsnC family transcriptional regulator [uncultured Roseobacter sp.]|uniref:Lrp/AsnC family transcriptional regulator n=1 Tax=uncultured Roseobacter sp. TaxID=114847 RepID=UPI00261485F6|nr:Lrp/AsnC family transcriptional regulator [uncultured Roseobacter sp.]